MHHSGYTNVAYSASDQYPAESEFDRIASRLAGMTNVLSSTNDSQDHTIGRLFGPAPEAANGPRAVPVNAPGSVGAIHAALDLLQLEVDRASAHVGPFARL